MVDTSSGRRVQPQQRRYISEEERKRLAEIEAMERETTPPEYAQQRVNDNVATQTGAIDELFSDTDPANADLVQQLKEVAAQEGASDLQESTVTKQILTNAPSGVAQIPTDIVSGVAMLSQGGVSAFDALIADNAEQQKMNYMERLASDFTDGMFSNGQDGAMARVEHHLNSVAQQLAEKNPNATPEQLEKYMAKYQEGEEFNDYFTSLMTPGFRIGLQGNKYANKVFGVNKLPHQQTEGDDFIQIAAQSLIPTKLATMPLKAATNAIMDTALSKAKKSALKEVTARARKIAQTKAGKVAGFVAESVVPMTSHYGPGRVASNIVGGGVINDAIRYAQDKPSIAGDLLTDDDPKTDEIDFIETPDAGPIPVRRMDALMPDVAAGEPPHGHGENVEGGIDGDTLASGMSAAAIFGIPGIRRGLLRQGRQAAANAATAGGATVPSHGPSITKQAITRGSAMEPSTTQTGAAGAVDINMPIKKVVNKYKQAGDTEITDKVDYLSSSGTNISRNDAYANFFSSGIMPNSRKTIPQVEIEKRFAALPPEKQQVFLEYAHSLSTQQDVDLNVNSLQTAMRHELNNYNLAQASGDRNAMKKANIEYSKAAQRLADVQADKHIPATATTQEDTTRPSNVQWSAADRARFIQRGNSDPEIMGVVNDIKRMTSDMLDAQVANGLMTRTHATRLKTQRPFYFPLSERAYANLFEGTPIEGSDVSEAARRALMFKDKVKGMMDWNSKPQGDTEFYVAKHERNITGEGVKVNRPLHPVIALRRMARDVTGEIVTNNARRDVIDLMRNLPGALGTELKPFMFKIGNRTVHQISPEQFRVKGIHEQVNNHNIDSKGNPLVRVIRDGQYEFWQFSNSAVANTLQFNPTFAVPLLNMGRKLLQIGYTGFVQPGFAPLAVMRDIGVAAVTANTNRYNVGTLGGWSSRLMQHVFGMQKETANRIAGKFDPSVVVTPLQGMTYKVLGDITEASAKKIAYSLRTNSGVLGAIAQLHPNGQAWLMNAGRWMQRVFDDTSYKTYKYNARTGLTLFIDSAKIIDDYDLEKSIAAGRIKSVITSPMRISLATMKYIAQTMQEGMRIGFFAENYRPNMTKHQIDLLLQATNNLTGDLSRSSKSKIIQGIASVFPFTNAAMQGTRHIFNASMPSSVAKQLNSKLGTNILDARVEDFWTRMAAYVGMTTLTSAAFMQDWGAEAMDWWYNQVPDWKRASGIPFPNAQAIIYYHEHGEWPPFHPNYVNVAQFAPELAAYKATFTAGLRALGWIGPATQTTPYSPVKEITSGLKQYIAFMAPSILSVPAALSGLRAQPANMITGDPMYQEISQPAFQGGNPDQMDFNSYIDQWYHDVASAVLGTVGSIQVQALNSGVEEFAESGKFIDALAQYGRRAWTETKERMPEIDIPVLFDATNRYYVSNPEGDYVHKVEENLAPIFGQHQVEVDKESGAFAEGLGLEPPPKINDDFLYGITMMTYDMVKKKGEYKAATTAYSELRKQQSILEGNRNSLSSKQYEIMRTKYTLAQQALNKTRAKILYGTELRLQEVFGDQFKQQYGMDLTFENMSKAVRKNVLAQ